MSIVLQLLALVLAKGALATFIKGMFESLASAFADRENLMLLRVPIFEAIVPSVQCAVWRLPSKCILSSWRLLPPIL